jgi:hypothetical protein
MQKKTITSIPYHRVINVLDGGIDTCNGIFEDFSSILYN